jgi:hypothetical protein
MPADIVLTKVPRKELPEASTNAYRYGTVPYLFYPLRKEHFRVSYDTVPAE